MAKFVRYNKVSLYLDSFSYILLYTIYYTTFTITGVNKTVRHTEDFVI